MRYFLILWTCTFLQCVFEFYFSPLCVWFSLFSNVCLILTFLHCVFDFDLSPLCVWFGLVSTVCLILTFIHCVFDLTLCVWWKTLAEKCISFIVFLSPVWWPTTQLGKQATNYLSFHILRHMYKMSYNTFCPQMITCTNNDHMNSSICRLNWGV